MLTPIAVLAGVALVGLAPSAIARDTIFIVGSSTLFPFANAVAEQFGRTSEFPTPKIEFTGSGGGIKLFCAGVGVEHPDITTASRGMKASEFDSCQEKGVKEITEVKIGYDGIAVVNSKEAPQLDLSLRDLFLALAKQVPDPEGGETLVDNPYETWKEVNAELPDTKIEVLGPPPTSGTRDAFAELAMEGGCKTFDFIAAMKSEDRSKYKAVCHGVREDGAYVEAGENDSLIVQKLEANPDALGIFGFSFLDQNSDKIQGLLIGGVAPTLESIASGEYPLSRSLYFYVKNAHVGVIPGIKEFVNELISDAALGPDGYLAERGLIPLPEDSRSRLAIAAHALSPMATRGPAYNYGGVWYSQQKTPETSAEPPGGVATEPVRVRASRLFAGSEQYPPKDFPAYGIVAFRSLPTPHDRERYLLVCEAYAATLPHADDLPMVPRTEQMVTVWPLKSSETADSLNGDTMRSWGVTAACNVAVDAYDLVVARQATKDAEAAGAAITPSGRGPYLLAWSPGKTKGSRDALVLVADLSGKETYDEVKAVFVQWADDIEKKPELWREGEGWSVEKVRTLIREWADRWGPSILSFVSRTS